MTLCQSLKRKAGNMKLGTDCLQQLTKVAQITKKHGPLRDVNKGEISSDVKGIFFQNVF